VDAFEYHFKKKRQVKKKSSNVIENPKLKSRNFSTVNHFYDRWILETGGHINHMV
jgi:hypothetical protein